MDWVEPLQVDELMREELKNLKAAVERDKGGKKGKKGKKSGKKKKGKVRLWLLGVIG